MVLGLQHMSSGPLWLEGTFQHVIQKINSSMATKVVNKQNPAVWQSNLLLYLRSPSLLLLHSRALNGYIHTAAEYCCQSCSKELNTVIFMLILVKKGEWQPHSIKKQSGLNQEFG